MGGYVGKSTRRTLEEFEGVMLVELQGYLRMVTNDNYGETDVGKRMQYVCGVT